jgi:hypothetical protein
VDPRDQWLLWSRRNKGPMYDSDAIENIDVSNMYLRVARFQLAAQIKGSMYSHFSSCSSFLDC